MNRAVDKSHPAAQRNNVPRVLINCAVIIKWLFIAMLLSVLLEWVGLTFFWKAEGVGHSENMIKKELDYLNSDFKKSIIVARPVDFAESMGSRFYYVVFEWTRFTTLLRWLEKPDKYNESQIRLWLKTLYEPVALYIVAAKNAITVFGVRIGVLTLAMPAFVLFGLAALADGLVERDLRRWGGGRESAFMYHHAKKIILPSIILMWIIYLSLPVSVHPNFIILPFALMFSVAVTITAEKFKKYI